MKQRLNYPNASVLIESMRSIGYTFETALCDIIDNSIYAKAKNIEIECNVNENDFLCILDDGEGMDNNGLFEAMRYGSKDPKDIRAEGDLGRFGLGLKSASLSQCSKLTVISKVKDNIYGLSWDLEHIKKSNDWNLLEYEQFELDQFPLIERLKGLESGTLVVWQNLDRVDEGTENFNQTLSRLLKSSEDRISLVFHRIISEDGINISLNKNLVEALDPFLEKNSMTQIRREETIKIDGETIKVKPFVLPHVNKLNQNDFKKIGGKETIRNDQGFYIYRNKRLIIWGTWFKLNNYSELTRLARIRVDIPNTLDYVWSIDIKKSQASLPDKVKRALIAFVLETTGTSQEVHEYRGRRIGNKELVYVWNVIKKEESIHLEINENSPEIVKFISTLDNTQIKAFRNIIMDVERCIPVDTIFAQLAKNQKIFSYENDDGDLIDRISILKKEIDEKGCNGITVFENLKITEPFCSSKQAKERIEEILKEYNYD